MIRLEEVRSFLQSVSEDGNNSLEITGIRSIDDLAFDASSLGWCSDSNKNRLTGLPAGSVIVSHAVYAEMKALLPQLGLIPVEKPRSAFLKVLQEFFAEKRTFGFIHPTASIDPSVKYNPDTVHIGTNVVIAKACVLGDRITIGANTVINAFTEIGDDCTLGSNNTIGGVGFGYELNEENEYELMPHIGNVVLKNKVEIGNNVCIDRAVLGSTLLEDNVKVDNLVHIAHGVKIGKNSLVIANAMIAGSVEIGQNVWVSPSASIRQKLQVEEGALVGMGAVVVKNVAADSVVAGNPAKPFEKK